MSEWICHPCGVRYGQHNSVSTYHQGVCAWCGEERPVTQSRDYGNPKPPDRYEPEDAA